MALDIMTDFFYWNLDICSTFLRDSESYLILFSCFCLILFLLGMRGVISSLAGECRVCFHHLAFIETQGKVLITAGWEWEVQLFIWLSLTPQIGTPDYWMEK